MRVSLTPLASKDLTRLEEFLYKQTHSRQVLEHFKKEFEQAIKLISENPKGYSYVTGNSPIRKKLQWKYWYFYIELLEEIRILRIFHTSEDWLSEI